MASVSVDHATCSNCAPQAILFLQDQSSTSSFYAMDSSPQKVKKSVIQIKHGLVTEKKAQKQACLCLMHMYYACPAEFMLFHVSTPLSQWARRVQGGLWGALPTRR